MSNSYTRHLRLSDGRNLSYSEIGRGNRTVWIHCHGIPGSRLELIHLTEKLLSAGMRVIVPDRPGYGQSTPHAAYAFADHGSDLRQLAGHLQLDRFSISGFSGGGVFAMAAADSLCDRVDALTIAATPAVPLMADPFNHASELTANSWRAALADAGALATELEALTGSTEALGSALLEAVGENERRYLLSAPVYPDLQASLRAALEQGASVAARALARDSSLIARPWPFRPDHLRLKTRIIHGSGDRLVHSQHQQTLAALIPGAESCLIEGTGHFGILPHLWAGDGTLR